MLRFCIALLGLVSTVSYSETYRMFVGFPVGGPVWNLAREYTEVIQKQSNVNIVIETYPGAGSSIAGNKMLDSPKNTTILWGTTATLIEAPKSVPSVKYNVEKDFDVLFVAQSSDFCLMVNKKYHVHNYSQLRDLVLPNPGRFNVGTGTPGSAIYNLAEQHAALDKFQVVLIPYKGLSVATTALIGGENLLYIWGSRPECEKMRPYTNTILYTYRESLLPYKLDKLNFVNLNGVVTVMQGMDSEVKERLTKYFQQAHSLIRQTNKELLEKPLVSEEAKEFVLRLR
jgi:hypothetical protein